MLMSQGCSFRRAAPFPAPLRGVRAAQCDNDGLSDDLVAATIARVQRLAHRA
jgi:hypothetical protein